MTRRALFALTLALVAVVQIVPVAAQPLALPNVRSPEADPNLINPAPVVAPGASTGTLGPTTTTVIDTGTTRAPSGVKGSVSGQTPRPAPADTLAPPKSKKVDADPDISYADDEPQDGTLVITRKKHKKEPGFVMQSGPTGKGVELRITKGRDEDDEMAWQNNARRRGRNAPRNAYDEEENDDEDGDYRTNRRGAGRDSHDETYDDVDDFYYHRDQLIPYKYRKHNGVGLYRPWMYDVKWSYWYCRNYRPFIPGAPDRYSPMLTPYGIYPPGNAYRNGANVPNVGRMSVDDMLAAGAYPTPNMDRTPVGTTTVAPPQNLPGAPAYANPMPAAPMAGAVAPSPAPTTSGPTTSAPMTTPSAMAAPTPMAAPQSTYMAAPRANYMGASPYAAINPYLNRIPGSFAPGYYNYGAGPHTDYAPWSLPSQYPTNTYGHGVHPGFDGTSYWPRHAGTYSPFVGFYGFGGRFHYGYGPYNYEYSDGYSGFGWAGSFRNGIWTSGLQY